MTHDRMRRASRPEAAGTSDPITLMAPAATRLSRAMRSGEPLRRRPLEYCASSHNTEAERKSRATRLDGSRPREALLVAVLPAEAPESLNRSMLERVPRSSSTNGAKRVNARTATPMPSTAARGSTTRPLLSPPADRPDTMAAAQTSTAATTVATRALTGRSFREGCLLSWRPWLISGEPAAGEALTRRSARGRRDGRPGAGGWPGPGSRGGGGRSSTGQERSARARRGRRPW